MLVVCLSEKEENTEIDWEKAQQIVLVYLNDKYSTISQRLRSMKNFVFNDPETFETVLISPNDAILEVEAMSPLGKRIVAAEISKLQRMNQ